MRQLRYQALKPALFEGDGFRPIECLIVRCLLHSRLDIPDATLRNDVSTHCRPGQEAVIIYLAQVIIRYLLGQVPPWLAPWSRITDPVSASVGHHQHQNWYRYHADHWLIIGGQFPAWCIIPRHRLTYQRQHLLDFKQVAALRAAFLYRAAQAHLTHHDRHSMLPEVWSELGSAAKDYCDLLEYFGAGHLQLIHSLYQATSIKADDRDHLLDLWLEWKKDPRPDLISEIRQLATVLGVVLPPDFPAN